MNVKPITPGEVYLAAPQVPDHVIETWNKLIAKNWDGRQATIMQKEAIKALGGTGGEKMAWLNIEEIFRQAGWVVEYDKPGYNETYEASFKFTKGRRRTDGQGKEGITA